MAPVGTSKKWCWNAVSTETPISDAHTCTAHTNGQGTCLTYRTHRITSSAMCSDGARLNGLPTMSPNAAKNGAQIPVTGGIVEVSRSGNSRKIGMATA
jgi:hypothetical protein